MGARVDLSPCPAWEDCAGERSFRIASFRLSQQDRQDPHERPPPRVVEAAAVGRSMEETGIGPSRAAAAGDALANSAFYFDAALPWT